MNTNNQNIVDELKKLKDKLETVFESQKELKKDVAMIFADITHFENLVLRVLDRNNTPTSREECHH